MECTLGGCAEMGFDTRWNEGPLSRLRERVGGEGVNEG